MFYFQTLNFNNQIKIPHLKAIEIIDGVTDD